MIHRDGGSYFICISKKATFEQRLAGLEGKTSPGRGNRRGKDSELLVTRSRCG